MRLSARHPRYKSLVVRARLADASRRGLVVPEGLIAHGRGETFDYLLGERTSPGARRAERAAAVWVRAAARPVLSVNGNVAALAAREVARLQQVYPALGVEVNLFHRTPGRAEQVRAALEHAGATGVLGVRPTARIPGLPSDRARVDRRGIWVADLCIVPLEDGDRTAALRAAGKRVVAVDLNPLSRTTLTADLPIVDEVTRALGHLADDLDRATPAVHPGRFPPFDRARAIADALATIDRRIRKAAGPRWPTAPGRG